MDKLANAILYILLFGVVPMVYCILSFKWIIRFLSKVDTVEKTLYACILCGVGFVVFQVVSIMPLDVGNISDRLDFSLDYSWIGVLNHILVGTNLEDWFPENLWVIEAIYVLFYMVIGLILTGGMKLWKTQAPIRYVGLGTLILCFCVYTFGIYFWMVTGLYL